MQDYEFVVLEKDRYIPIVVIGSFSSFLSMMGSASLLYMTSKKRHKIMHRLVFGLSMADMIASSTSLIMPYMVPSFLGLAGASGSFATCSAAGFFFSTFVMVGCCYNFYLSWYYLNTVRSNWKEFDFHRPVENLGHAFAFLVPISINTFAAATQSFNPSPLANNLCTYYTWPWECEQNENLECERSRGGIIFTLMILRGIFTFIPTICCFVFTYLVWSFVKKTLKRSTAYRFAGDIDTASNERLKEVSKQAVLYSLAYLNTFFWPFFGLVLAAVVSQEELQAKKNNPGYYTIQIVYWMFYPLQGFLNFFIYCRVKVKTWKKAQPERSLFSIYLEILKSNESPPANNAQTRETGQTATSVH